MSTGTSIIQEALQNIGAHSVASPASPDSMQVGMRVLNGMIAAFEDDGIKMGCVPLKDVGSELSEPLGARNAIISLLSLLLHPKFPGSQISPELKSAAEKGLNQIKRQWKTITIPKPVARDTYPKGQGNNDYLENAFFEEGAEIG